MGLLLLFKCKVFLAGVILKGLMYCCSGTALIVSALLWGLFGLVKDYAWTSAFVVVG